MASFDLGSEEGVQTAVIIVLMHRLKMRTLTFDEAELLEAMDAANPDGDDFDVEFHVDAEEKNIMVKLA